MNRRRDKTVKQNDTDIFGQSPYGNDDNDYHNTYYGASGDADDDGIAGKAFVSRLIENNPEIDDLEPILSKAEAELGPLVPRESAFQAIKDALPDMSKGIWFFCVGVVGFPLIYLILFYPSLVLYQSGRHTSKDDLIPYGLVLAELVIAMFYGLSIIIKAWPKPGEIFVNGEKALREYGLRRLCSHQDDIAVVKNKWGNIEYSRCSHDIRAFRFPTNAPSMTIAMIAQREGSWHEPPHFKGQPKPYKQKSDITLDLEGIQLCIAQASPEGLRLCVVNDHDIGTGTGIGTEEHAARIGVQQDRMNEKLGIFPGKSGKTRHDPIANFVVRRPKGFARDASDD